MNIEAMIEAVQTELGVHVDGRAGPQTWAAIYIRIVAPKLTDVSLVGGIAPADPRSEKNIATLLPEVQPYGRALIRKATLDGIRIKVIGGLRAYAEQDELYAQGRTKPGKIVTNAQGGYSNHNFGIVFDVGVFEGASYLPDSIKYKVVGALGMELGLEWGGNWKTLVDQPHFQLRPIWATELTEKQMLAELRNRASSGTPVYA
jgi:peptidoglycan L-alanyl-D-glutamate endopeptidase CwlK